MLPLYTVIIMALPDISHRELEDDMERAQISNTTPSKAMTSRLVLLLGVGMCGWSCFRKPMQTPICKKGCLEWYVGVLRGSVDFWIW